MANELLKKYQGMKSGPSMGLYRHITESENLIEARNQEKRKKMMKLLGNFGEGIDKKWSNWKKAKHIDKDAGSFLNYTLKSGKGGKYEKTHLDDRVKDMGTTSITRDAYTKLRDFSQKGRSTEKERLDAHLNEKTAKDQKGQISDREKDWNASVMKSINQLKPEKGRINKGHESNERNYIKEGWDVLKGELLTPDQPERKGTIYKPEYEHGGMIKGKDHDQGGVNINVEGGEFIFPENIVKKVGAGFFNRLLKMLKGG